MTEERTYVGVLLGKIDKRETIRLYYLHKTDGVLAEPNRNRKRLLVYYNKLC